MGNFEETLIKVIVEVLVSLEFSSEGQVDEDYAVEIQERVGGILGDLNDQERKVLVTSIARIAHNYDPKVASFLRDFEDNFGL